MYTYTGEGYIARCFLSLDVDMLKPLTIYYLWYLQTSQTLEECDEEEEDTAEEQLPRMALKLGHQGNFSHITE